MAKAGCQVFAIDSDPNARRATIANARLNGLEFPVLSNLEQAPKECQLLILADFLYDPSNLKELEALCEVYKNVLVGDCRLKNLPHPFVELGRFQQKMRPDLDWGEEFDTVYLAAYGPWLNTLGAPLMPP